MKTLEININEEGDYEEEWQKAVGDGPMVASVDWKTPVEDVFDEIDKQHAEHGLEIEMIEDGDDSYTWRIVRRSA